MQKPHLIPAGVAVLAFAAVLGPAIGAEADCAKPAGVTMSTNGGGWFSSANSSQRPFFGTSGDSSYSNTICNGSFSSAMWSHYGMHESDWNEGLGFSNVTVRAG